MRTQQILTVLQNDLNLDLAKTEHFETNANFRGGWEVWMQCEMAMAFFNNATSQSFEREYPYPSGDIELPYLKYDPDFEPAAWAVANQSARADFKIERIQGMADTTFLELKCLKSTENTSDAWDRFRSDVTKMSALHEANNELNCVALLATWGTFSAEDLESLSWCWAGDLTARVLDYSQNPPLQTTLQNVAQDGNNRQFIVGVGVA